MGQITHFPCSSGPVIDETLQFVCYTVFAQCYCHLQALDCSDILTCTFARVFAKKGSAGKERGAQQKSWSQSETDEVACSTVAWKVKENSSDLVNIRVKPPEHFTSGFKRWTTTLNLNKTEVKALLRQSGPAHRLTYVTTSDREVKSNRVSGNDLSAEVPFQLSRIIRLFQEKWSTVQ